MDWISLQECFINYVQTKVFADCGDGHSLIRDLTKQEVPETVSSGRQSESAALTFSGLISQLRSANPSTPVSLLSRNGKLSAFPIASSVKCHDIA